MNRRRQRKGIHMGKYKISREFFPFSHFTPPISEKFLAMAVPHMKTPKYIYKDKAQILPLPDMYGKNLTFKTDGVDGCDCEETLKLIAEGKLDIEPLITHTYPLAKIDEAYELFENKRDGVIKIAVEC